MNYRYEPSLEEKLKRIAEFEEEHHLMGFSIRTTPCGGDMFGPTDLTRGGHAQVSTHVAADYIIECLPLLLDLMKRKDSIPRPGEVPTPWYLVA